MNYSGVQDLNVEFTPDKKGIIVSPVPVAFTEPGSFRIIYNTNQLGTAGTEAIELVDLYRGTYTSTSGNFLIDNDYYNLAFTIRIADIPNFRSAIIEMPVGQINIDPSSSGTNQWIASYQNFQAGINSRSLKRIKQFLKR